MGQGKPCPVGLGKPALKAALNPAGHVACPIVGPYQLGPRRFAGHYFSDPFRAIPPGHVARDCIAAVTESPNQAGLKNFLSHGEPFLRLAKPTTSLHGKNYGSDFQANHR